MKIILLQTDIVWHNPELNKKHIEHKINDLKQVDLVVLPEMFTTGFATNPNGIAELADTETLGWMKRIAVEKNFAIAGSVAVEENGDYFNRFYFVKPDGSFAKYDKHHLFTYGGEHKEYKAGEEKVVVEYNGFNILLQICYDLRFPVFSRNLGGEYDMIIYVASWPTVRLDAWNCLLKARAIENLCYVVAVNRVGNDPYCEYSGGSHLFDYMGKAIASAEYGKEDIVSGEIDKGKLDAFRNKFPALNDADKFEIIK